MSRNEFEAPDFAILMVDDLPKNLQVLGSMLKTQNYQVEFATGGQGALNWLEKKKFDLVLLDLMMPEMDGFTVLKKAKQDKETKKIPIIVMSNLGQVEDIDKAKSLGAKDYLIKSNYSMEEVVNKLSSFFKALKNNHR